jgi:hypothetical protein
MPDAKESISYYVKERLLRRINSAPNVSNRFAILFHLFNDVIGSIIIIALGFFANKLVKNKLHIKHAIFWLVFALCGVLPIMLTMVQKAFYIVQVFPFIAISVAIICVPLFDAWLTFLQHRAKYFLIFKKATIFIFSGSICFVFYNFGKFSRHQIQIQDVDAVAKIIGKTAQISATDSLYNDSFIYFYMARFANTSVMNDSTQLYMIAYNGQKFPNNYKLLKKMNAIQIATKLY